MHPLSYSSHICVHPILLSDYLIASGSRQAWELLEVRNGVTSSLCHQHPGQSWTQEKETPRNGEETQRKGLDLSPAVNPSILLSLTQMQTHIGHTLTHALILSVWPKVLGSVTSPGEHRCSIWPSVCFWEVEECCSPSFSLQPWMPSGGCTPNRKSRFQQSL